MATLSERFRLALQAALGAEYACTEPRDLEYYGKPYVSVLVTHGGRHRDVATSFPGEASPEAITKSAADAANLLRVSLEPN